MALRFLSVLIGLGFLCACGGGGSPAPAAGVALPTITSFTASPSTLVPGASATLTWTTANATKRVLDPGGLEVTGVSEYRVSPATTTTYTLSASGASGLATAQVTVTVQAAAPDVSAVSALLDNHLGAYPQGVLVVVNQGDVEVYRHGIGTLSDTVQKPIASATKWYSAAIVLRLAEQGKLSLDDPIGKYLPSFPRPGQGDATLRQCFGMRSGLFLQDPDYETDPTLTLPASVDRIAAHTPLVFQPGTQWAYDGDGMQVVGRICEIVSGKDWCTLARDELFTPLGMASSDYGLLFLNPAIAGGGRSTLADYQTFLRMILMRGLTAGGARYLSEASVETFFTNGTQGLPVYYSPWPASLLTAYDRKPDYGFGSWIQAQNPATGRVEEVASPGKFGTWPWVDRKRGLRGVIFAADPMGFSLGIATNLQVIQAIRDVLDR